MISALADAGAAFDDATTSTPRSRCADFLVTRMRDDDGRLLRTYNRGQARLRARTRGPRLPARGADRALRGDVRPALVRRGARARRHDPRALLRRRERRLLLDRRRPRAADHAPQGHRGQPDPGRPVGGHASGCCGSPRSPASTATRRPRSARSGCCTRSRRSTRRVRPPAAGDRLPRLAPCARSRSSDPTAAPLERVVRCELPPPRRAGGRRGRRRAAARGARARSTAAPPPTSASTSCASGR